MDLPIKLISTDFDGTLHADFGDPPVPETLQDLIASLQERGVRWIINTGRDMSSLMETMGRARMRIRPDYLVLVEREIYFHQEHQYVALDDWNEACERDHAALFGQISRDLPGLADWVNERYDADVYEDPWSPFCLVAKSIEDADAICDHLEDYCQMVPDLAVVRNDVYARFSHAAYSKGTALSEIAHRLDIPSEFIFAAGDHMNDLPMLQSGRATHLAAPANAVLAVQEAVKSAGGFVSDLKCGQGVEDALRRVLGAGR